MRVLSDDGSKTTITQNHFSISWTKCFATTDHKEKYVKNKHFGCGWSCHVDNMQQSGSVRGSRTQRYRPASEFDESTLARKREYWRNRKREQRAKLSAMKKERAVQTTKTINQTGLPTVTQTTTVSKVLYSHPSTHTSFKKPPSTFLNNDESYRIGTNNTDLVMTYSPDPLSEKKEINVSSCDKIQDWKSNESDRLTGQPAPQQSFPHLPEASEPQCKIEDCNDRSLTANSEKRTLSLVSPNGAQVPVTHVADVQSRKLLQGQTQDNTVIFNGSLTQHHNSISGASGQYKNCVLKVRANNKCTSTSPRQETIDHKPVLKVTNITKTTENKSTQEGEKNILAQHNSSVVFQCRSDETETEEEKAAKRREYWRIKKREQRAAMKKVKNRSVNIVTNNKDSSCVAFEHQPLVWCNGSQRVATKPLLTPLFTSSLPGSGEVPNVSASYTDSGFSTVTKEPVSIFPTLDSARSFDSNQNIPSKTGKSSDNKTLLGAVTTKNNAHTVTSTLGHDSSIQFKAVLDNQTLEDDCEQFLTRSRPQRRRFPEIQRMFRARTPRISYFPPERSGILNSQSGFTAETEEEKLAKKREYWRIRKREQRAKLSKEVKAKLKERDSLMRRIKRYQSILEEMRKARATSNKTLSPPGNTLPGDMETIGGFIKEDGTLTTEIPQATRDNELSQIKPKPEVPLFQNFMCGVTSNVAPSGDKNSSVNRWKTNAFDVNSSQPRIPLSTETLESIPTRTKLILRGTEKNQFIPHVQSTYPKTTLVKPRLRLPNFTKVVTSNKYFKEEPSGYKLPEAPAVALSQKMQLTPEERLAKKREYWRIKKREQRAKHSTLTRQALSNFKYTSFLRRRQRLGRISALSLARNARNNIQSTVPEIVPTVLDENIKKERDSPPTFSECKLLKDSSTDLPSCKDIKPPLIQSPVEDVEVNPRESMDSQETTLLAVASMKKLLEESLSSMTDSDGLPACKPDKLLCKSVEDLSNNEIKSSLLQENKESEGLSLGSCDASIACTKPLQDVCLQGQVAPCSVAISSARVLSEHISDSSSFKEMQLSSGQSCFKGQRQRVRCQELKRVQQLGRKVPFQSEEEILQKKREYWRMMKREQRARKAAWGKGKKVKQSDTLVQVLAPVERNIQCIKQEQVITKTSQEVVQANASSSPKLKAVTPQSLEQQIPTSTQPGRFGTEFPVLQQQISTTVQFVTPSDGGNFARMKAVNTIPTVVMINSTATPSSELPKGTASLQMKSMSIELPSKQQAVQMTRDCSTKQKVSASRTSDAAKPQLTRTQLNEEIQRKKREYWRGRKREQRARKAAQEREMKLAAAGGVCEDSMHSGEETGNVKLQIQQTEDCSQWINCTEDAELLNVPDSPATWRARFLMDFDPVNQLLVCMVCGELQHSHSVEGVHSHIEEAHPDTLRLGAQERQHIQEAWDEQVSQRERFFSSQLLQRSQTLAGTWSHENPPAEVEVLIGLDDFTTVKSGKSTKTKSVKKV